MVCCRSTPTAPPEVVRVVAHQGLLAPRLVHLVEVEVDQLVQVEMAEQAVTTQVQPV